MRRTVMTGAMYLVISTTEVAAACPDINAINGSWGFFQFSTVGGQPTAIDCVLTISNNMILPPIDGTNCFEDVFGDPIPTWLQNQQIIPIVGCDFMIGLPPSNDIFVGGDLCAYKGQFGGPSGDNAAGNIYCSPSGRRGTFNLIRR